MCCACQLPACRLAPVCLCCLLPRLPLSASLSSLLPESKLSGLPFPPASFPCLALCCPAFLWQLCACLSGRFYQQMCRGGLCCCGSGAAVLGGRCFFCFAAWRCVAVPFVTAVCLPDWPLLPALVPGWACCCISGVAAFGGFCFCFFSWRLAVLRFGPQFVSQPPAVRRNCCSGVGLTRRLPLLLPFSAPDWPAYVLLCRLRPPSLTQLRCICSTTLSW